MFILSISSLILFILLVFWGKLKLIWASLISFFATLTLALFIWRVYPNIIGISTLKGVFVAFDIFIIILGAIFFFETLKSTKIIDNLNVYLRTFSKDYRIQVILLAWFLENFLEGTAGFGTPSTVVAPILTTIGFSPILSVVIALLGNSTSVTFGAAGTPIRVGFAGLDTTHVPLYSALINIVGLIIPVFILWAATSGQKERRNHFLEALPLAIFSGIAFVVPSIFLVFLGQEFPSIIGSVIGLAITLLAIKLNIFVPKTVRSLIVNEPTEEKMPLLKVLFPYVLLIILLVTGKFILGNIGYTVNFGLKHTFSLFNPGLAFIVASIPTILLWGKGKRLSGSLFIKSAKSAIEPFLTIAILSAMVQVMINSGQNTTGNISFMQIISNSFKTSLLPLFAPFMGAFGSFLTGSATISNIMFGKFLQEASQVTGFGVATILSLELTGAAVGNMISLADILPALAVVGIKGQVLKVIKGVIIPCTICVLLIGLIGLLIT